MLKDAAYKYAQRNQDEVDMAPKVTHHPMYCEPAVHVIENPDGSAIIQTSTLTRDVQWEDEFQCQQVHRE